VKFAAIDIGSNATRLLFSNVHEEKGGNAIFKKAELIRVPLRLGEDVFLKGRILKEKADRLMMAMSAFRYLLKVYGALDYRACATAAMREAENRWELVDRIKKEAGLKVEIIDGKTEADIIYSNHIEKMHGGSGSYLYIDIGGGSTEITLFSNGKCIASQSFNVGTIRMLHEQIDKEYWSYYRRIRTAYGHRLGGKHQQAF
jgi:exopolyphosphatase / guanosine-5'-triphosphate,3'-diphosphate pyrophosphatase